MIVADHWLGVYLIMNEPLFLSKKIKIPVLRGYSQVARPSKTPVQRPM